MCAPSSNRKVGASVSRSEVADAQSGRDRRRPWLAPLQVRPRLSRFDTLGDGRRFQRFDVIQKRITCRSHVARESQIAFPDCKKVQQQTEIIPRTPSEKYEPGTSNQCLRACKRVARRNFNDAVGRSGPRELAAFEALGIERHAKPIMPENLDQIALAPMKTKRSPACGFSAPPAPAPPSHSCRFVRLLTRRAHS